MKALAEEGKPFVDDEDAEDAPATKKRNRASLKVNCPWYVRATFAKGNEMSTNTVKKCLLEHCVQCEPGEDSVFRAQKARGAKLSPEVLNTLRDVNSANLGTHAIRKILEARKWKLAGSGWQFLLNLKVRVRNALVRHISLSLSLSLCNKPRARFCYRPLPS